MKDLGRFVTNRKSAKSQTNFGRMRICDQVISIWFTKTDTCNFAVQTYRICGLAPVWNKSINIILIYTISNSIVKHSQLTIKCRLSDESLSYRYCISGIRCNFVLPSDTLLIFNINYNLYINKNVVSTTYRVHRSVTYQGVSIYLSTIELNELRYRVTCFLIFPNNILCSLLAPTDTQYLVLRNEKLVGII